ARSTPGGRGRPACRRRSLCRPSQLPLEFVQYVRPCPDRAHRQQQHAQRQEHHQRFAVLHLDRNGQEPDAAPDRARQNEQGEQLRFHHRPFHVPCCLVHTFFSTHEAPS